jgi:hypothetical protein
MIQDLGVDDLYDSAVLLYKLKDNNLILYHAKRHLMLVISQLLLDIVCPLRSSHAGRRFMLGAIKRTEASPNVSDVLN